MPAPTRRITWTGCGNSSIFELVPVSDDHFVGWTDPSVAWTTVSYGQYTPDQNRSGGDYIYAGTRLNPRMK